MVRVTTTVAMALLLSAACAGASDDVGPGATSASSMPGATDAPASGGAGAAGAGGDGAAADGPTQAAEQTSGLPADLMCAEGEVQLRGRAGNMVIDARLQERGHVFWNKLGDDPGQLDISGAEFALQLQFDQAVLNGRSVPARGSLSLEGLDAGNCDTAGTPGTLAIDDDGDGGRFTLRELNEAPYCEGASLDGMIEGCFRYRPLGF